MSEIKSISDDTCSIAETDINAKLIRWNTICCEREMHLRFCTQQLHMRSRTRMLSRIVLSFLFLFYQCYSLSLVTNVPSSTTPILNSAILHNNCFFWISFLWIYKWFVVFLCLKKICVTTVSPGESSNKRCHVHHILTLTTLNWFDPNLFHPNSRIAFSKRRQHPGTRVCFFALTLTLKNS